LEKWLIGYIGKVKKSEVPIHLKVKSGSVEKTCLYIFAKLQKHTKNIQITEISSWKQH